MTLGHRFTAGLGFAVLFACAESHPVGAQQEAAPIRDNSFLIEEAYNQDRNVVQHIANFTDTRAGARVASFTDEWPLGSVRNQLSVGVTLVDHDAGGGFHAVALNYRHQLVGNPDAAVIVSPRLSFYADLGSSRGSPYAMQVNVPVTAVLSGAFVSHYNLGLTVGGGGDPAVMNAGVSLVWLARRWMNFLVEALFLGAPGDAPTYAVSPGVRWAFNLGKLQVVPGVAFPLDVLDRKGDAIFLYLSFEHPFGPTD